MRNISVKLLNLDQWFRRCHFRDIFLSRAQSNFFCNFGGGHYEEHLIICEIILNLDQWFRRCLLKISLI